MGIYPRPLEMLVVFNIHIPDCKFFIELPALFVGKKRAGRCHYNGNKLPDLEEWLRPTIHHP